MDLYRIAVLHFVFLEIFRSATNSKSSLARRPDSVLIDAEIDLAKTGSK